MDGYTLGRDPNYTVTNLKTNDILFYAMNGSVSSVVSTLSVTNTTELLRWINPSPGTGEPSHFIYKVLSNGSCTLTASGAGSGGQLYVLRY